MIQPDFAKYPDGLVPVIIQDANTQRVLMLGYMNEVSLAQTLSTKLVTFYSRSRQEIWVKGATSGNYLHFKEIFIDCDSDSLLVKAIPDGPVCHTGKDTCFGEQNNVADGFIKVLENTIINRKKNPSEKSYTNSLFASGIPRMAQKVGEEAVELVIEAIQQNDEKFIGEAADLVYHYLVLLQAKGMSLRDVEGELYRRNKK
jgi:phosphoribosyl-ATP pyrophosphohydrolase/phosphoribosyl-AMP cyclohydrolase